VNALTEEDKSNLPTRRPKQSFRRPDVRQPWMTRAAVVCAAPEICFTTAPIFFGTVTRVAVVGAPPHDLPGREAASATR
jgi:hypothetical protein